VSSVVFPPGSVFSRSHTLPCGHWPREGTAAGAVQAGKQGVRCEQNALGLGAKIRSRNYPFHHRVTRISSEKQTARIRRDPRLKDRRACVHFAGARLSADFCCRGVIETTVYSLSFSSRSSTCSSILSLWIRNWAS